MEKVEDVEFVEVEEVNPTSEEYDKLPKSAKASIAKIRGEKNIFDNADVNTYLEELWEAVTLFTKAKRF